jgi:hypothetical protein
MKSEVNTSHAALTDYFFDFVARYFHKLKQALSERLLIRVVAQHPEYPGWYYGV